jgi:hypothetical protein
MDAREMRALAAAAAMDSIGGNGMAFVSAQLELVRPKLIEPLSSVTHDRDITVTFGGGFIEYMSAWAADYGSTGSNQYGLQGTSNTGIPQIQVSVEKGTWKAFIWSASSIITDLDMKKLAAAAASGQPAPFSMEKLIRTGCNLVWNKALDKVTYTGWLGTPGLVNNPDVTAILSPANGTGASRLWSAKTPQQIQADINTLLLGGVKASGYSLEGLPDTILMDWDTYNLLTQPYVLGGIGGFNSIMEYVMNNNIARKNGVDLKILPLSNPWLLTAGTGGTVRMVAYRNDEDNVLLHVPAPMAPAMTVPSVKDGGAYETLWNGNIGQVQWLRSQTATYLDGAGVATS